MTARFSGGMRIVEAKNERYCGRSAYVVKEGWLRRRFRIVIEGETFGGDHVIQQEQVDRVQWLAHEKVEKETPLGAILTVFLGPAGAIFGGLVDGLGSEASKTPRRTEKFVVSTVEGDWLILEGKARHARQLRAKR